MLQRGRCVVQRRRNMQFHDDAVRSSDLHGIVGGTYNVRKYSVRCRFMYRKPMTSANIVLLWKQIPSDCCVFTNIMYIINERRRCAHYWSLLANFTRFQEESIWSALFWNRPTVARYTFPAQSKYLSESFVLLHALKTLLDTHSYWHQRVQHSIARFSYCSLWRVWSWA